MFLTSASVINICIWFWLRFYRYQNTSIASIFRFRSDPRCMVWLSALYVFVCAFRSVLPRADVQRICLFDTWFSSVFIGRSLATIAELGFVAQWSLALSIAGQAAHDQIVQKIARAILLAIVVAEICSWYAVITTHYLGNSIEESLWGVSYTLVGIALFRLWLKLKGHMRLAAGFAVVGSIGYVIFMFTVDVPMYVTRLLADNAAGKQHLGLIDGLIDLNTRWHVTHSIVDWKTEIPWMTLYFSFAVLVSLALCLLPLSADGWKKYLKAA